jgi:hypothetical protein
MRFTIWNAFIFSSFALVLLIIPVANADDNFVARIIVPGAVDTLYPQMPLGVIWYVVKKENPSTVCHRRFLTAGITAGPSAASPRIYLLFAA